MSETTPQERLIAANRQARRRARLRGEAPLVTVPNLPLKTADDCRRALEFAVSLSEREPFRAQSIIAAAKTAASLLKTIRAERAYVAAGLGELIGIRDDETAK